MSWTDKQVAKMATLYKKGLSMAEIGKKLGLTKGQVVGKLHREGIISNSSNKDEKPVKKNAKTKVTAKKAPAKSAPVKKVEPKKPTPKKAAPAPKHEKPAIPVKEEKPAKKETKSNSKESAKAQEKNINHALMLAKLGKNQCRWPMGGTGNDDFHFCGKNVFTGKPYCFEHCKMSYVMTSPNPKKK